MTDYKVPSLTVDMIMEKNNKLLMIRRKSKTFNDYLAFPGGFVDYGETVEHAAKREAKEELNIDIIAKEILGVYSNPNRDPRGHVISIAFVCDFAGEPKAGDDAKYYEWLDLDSYKNEKLAFDHLKILENYLTWKEQKGTFWSTK